MPALPSSVIEPLWDQFAVLLLGAAYEKIADSACSATTIRDRRDE